MSREAVVQAIANGDYGALPPILSTHEAAQALRVCDSMAGKLCRSGKLRAVKVGKNWRVNRDSLLEFAGLA